MSELEPAPSDRRWWAIAAAGVAAVALASGGLWLATRGGDDAPEGAATKPTATGTADGGATTDDLDGTTDTADDGTTETAGGEMTTGDGGETTTGATTTSEPGPIELEGEGDETTESFRVGPGWRIEWENFGDHFEMAIRGDRNLGTVVSVDEPTSGLTTPPVGGRFRIHVEAEGRWMITIDRG